MVEFKIGSLKLKGRVFLAPMLEPNDIAFRLLCKKHGCALNFSGMVSPFTKQKIFLDDKPALQIFGNSHRGIKQFVEVYDSEVSMWDFNLGCPSKLSERLGHGAFMHKDLESIKKIFRTLRKSTKKPCSVKLRKSDNSIAIALLAQEEGFDMVTIHPRTFKQGYSGKPDYDFALLLKKNLSIPVCYSGDVNKKNVESILNDFDFVMVGRSAIGNPSFFDGGKNDFLEYLALVEKYGIYFRQIKFQAMCFTKGLGNAKDLRRRIMVAKNVEDVKSIFNG